MPWNEEGWKLEGFDGVLDDRGRFSEGCQIEEQATLTVLGVIRISRTESIWVEIDINEERHAQIDMEYDQLDIKMS